MASARRERSPLLPVQDHGGNLREVCERYGLDRVVDFSASINPLGHPEGLQDYLASVWNEVLHYPDRRCRGFREAAAETLGVHPDAVLAGNGSAELIDLVTRAEAPRRLLLCPPDFGLYEELCPEGVPAASVPRMESQGFEPDLATMAATVQPGDMVVLSNPGNPSGCAVSPAGFVPFLERCTRAGAALVVDEAFVDFCPDATLLSAVKEHPNLVVLRSLTKFYGIPGLRLGYLVAHPEGVRRVSRLQVPWSVNALSQAAGVYCLGRRDWQERSLAYVGHARERLAEQIGRLPGLKALPSTVNYLLMHVSPPAPPACQIYDALARRGILVRHCGSFGLGERYLRVAVRTEEENDLLVEGLAQVTAAIG